MAIIAFKFGCVRFLLDFTQEILRSNYEVFTNLGDPIQGIGGAQRLVSLTLLSLIIS